MPAVQTREWSKSPLVENIIVSPREKFFAGSDGGATVTVCDGASECLPEWPEGGSLPVATTSRRDGLQAECGSFPLRTVR
jgi:hypothetical protein